MDEYNESLILARRNIAALAEGIKLHEKIRAEQAAAISKLQEQVTNLSTAVTNLTLKVAVLNAASVGRGPTV
jgi:hypothetical protein